MDKRQLLAEMATGIGASESHDLFSLEPYGCRRKLWYRKLKAPTDFDFVESNDMKRGSALESIVVDIYRGMFPNATVTRTLPVCRAPDNYLLAHLDGAASLLLYLIHI